MVMTKRLAAILLAGLFLFLAACSNAPASPENSTAEDTKTPTVTPVSTQEDEVDEVVTPVIDNVKPISIVNNTHSDKVITSPTFKIPSELQDGSDTFILSPLISSSMVLQANMPVRLWGACLTNGGVAARVTKNDTNESRTFYGTAKDNYFEIYLGPTNYGGPYTIELIASDGKSITIDDVLFGEVYIAGGQSNMGWSMSQCYDGTTEKLLYEDILQNCDNDNIRTTLLWPKSSEEPIDELAAGTTSGWNGMSYSVTRNMSACAYFFARELNKQYNIPIGIVTSCMGGTSIYTWFPQKDAESLGFAKGQQPSFWYNSMINPIRKLTARGVIWYQGEGHADGYADLLKSMIEAWRREFDTPDLYFAVVQLPRFQEEDSWFRCREEDKKIASMLDNVTYSVNIDTGLLPEFVAEGDKLNDGAIHPYVKEPVGRRLADAVMQKFYGAEGVWRGPVLKTAKLLNGQVKVTFDNVGSGLTLVGDLAGFEICGTDGKYYDAVPALVSGRSVVLTCDKVKEPYKVRYGYSNYSSLIKGILKDCSQSVSLYNTKGKDNTVAFPAEQFWVEVTK